jgi:hypothetical protein
LITKRACSPGWFLMHDREPLAEGRAAPEANVET